MSATLRDDHDSDLLVPGIRQRIVIECDKATKATDWHTKQK